MRTRWKMVSAPGLVLAVGFLSGCGTAKSNFTPTRGQVLNGSDPAEGVQVTFVPLEGKDEPAARPAGVVGPDGTFSLSTYDPVTRETHEGAPPGKYAVLITWYPQAGLGGRNPDAPKALDRLGGRYKDPAHSPYRVEIQTEATELDPIRVSESGPNTNTGRPVG